MFGRPKRRPRYVVRKAKTAPPRYKWIARGGKNFVFDTVDARDVFQGSMGAAQSHAKALNHQTALRRENSYVFDALTGQSVYESESADDCRDHAAFLNQDYGDMLNRAADGRWFEVALALVRTHYARDPSDWVVRDTGFAFEVRTPDGVLVAQCTTYADAANVKALAGIAHTDMLTPRPQLEAKPPES